MVNLRYRHVNELYVTGLAHVLKDGTPIWLQVLSPFEQQLARDEAATARARRVLALRENGSDRQIQIRAGFLEDGRDAAITRLVDAKSTKVITKAIDELRSDPDWKERLDVLARGATDPSTPLTEHELQLLENLEADYTAEIRRRHDDEREFLRLSYMDADEDTLWQEYLDHWLDQQGGEVALTEFQLCRILYGARVCNGIKTEDKWDHAPCNGHQERVFTDRAEVINLPEQLLTELHAAAEAVEMTEFEAKNSARQMSSSASSHLPSEEEASTASTPDVTPATLPGS